MNRIKKGDIVRVDCHNAHLTIHHKAEVLYMPCAIGDSWHFKDIETGELTYVSEGITITKQPEGDKQ